MLYQEDINNLVDRLAIHRKTLSIYLDQLARQGRAFVAPSIIHGILETRQEIDRIKKTLRAAGVQISDHPDDDEYNVTAIHKESRYQVKDQKMDLENSHTLPDGNVSNEKSSLLIGALIDVSRSALDTIQASASKSSIQRAKVDRSINVIIEKFLFFGKTPEAEDILPRFGLFLYGYGFGVLRSSANKILNTLGIRSTKNNPDATPSEPIRDLFSESAAKENIPTTPLGTELNKYRNLYQRSVEAQLLDIGLGNSMLMQGLETVYQRFIQDITTSNYENMLLIVISDGNINNNDIEATHRTIEDMKKFGVQIICGYIGKENLVQSRVLYSQPSSTWSPDATRLFDFASSSTTSNPIIVRMLDLARENGWQTSTDAKLFIQVNQIEMLEELIDFILNAIRD